jgi:tetratricopeptide (TPR) repeat protein
LRNEEKVSPCNAEASSLASLLFFCCLLPVLCCLLLCSCTFPRIIVIEDPLTPEEHLNLGVTYEKNREFDNALKEYHAASEKMPLAYLYIGNVYFQKEELGKAESFYRKAIERDPSIADAYNNLAWLYCLKRERLDEAERLVMKAIELNPSKKNIYEDTARKIREARGN